MDLSLRRAETFKPGRRLRGRPAPGATGVTRRAPAGRFLTAVVLAGFLLVVWSGPAAGQGYVGTTPPFVGPTDVGVTPAVPARVEVLPTRIKAGIAGLPITGADLGGLAVIAFALLVAGRLIARRHHYRGGVRSAR